MARGLARRFCIFVHYSDLGGHFLDDGLEVLRSLQIGVLANLSGRAQEAVGAEAPSESIKSVSKRHASCGCAAPVAARAATGATRFLSS